MNASLGFTSLSNSQVQHMKVHLSLMLGCETWRKQGKGTKGRTDLENPRKNYMAEHEYR